MSYILDALRRAEAERTRERNPLPDLNTPVPPLVSASEADHRQAQPARTRWPWLVAVGSAAVLAGAGGAALLLGGGQTATRPTNHAVGVEVQPRDTPPEAIKPPATSIPPADAPAPRSPPPPPAAVRHLPPVAFETPAPEVSSSAPTTPAAPARAAARLPTATELPEALRRELPRLVLGGSVHSPDSASRFLLLNGEVVHEGATLAPGLTLERIQPSEAVFNLHGTRWRMAL